MAETEMNSTSSSLPEFNVLLLGESGVGKSLAINAFATYLKFADFDEAKSSDLVDIIKSKFTLPDPTTGDPLLIETGGNDNSQLPMSYSFEFGDRLIRLIDTLGFGDTGVVEQNKKNFDQIFEYLSSLNDIHAICVLAKATMSPLTAAFKFLLNELFSRMHKNSHENVFFCFTYSRSSLYGPGDGFASLKTFFQNDLKELKFKLSTNENCFFVDNESYRYLAAKKCAYTFSKAQEAMYEESWIKSSEQALEMILNIFDAQPHLMEESLSVNYAGNLLHKLMKTSLDMQNKMKLNDDLIAKEKGRLKFIIETKDNLVDLDEINKADSSILEINKLILSKQKLKESFELELNILNSVIYKVASVLNENCCMYKGIMDSCLKSSNVSDYCSENDYQGEDEGVGFTVTSPKTLNDNFDLNDIDKLQDKLLKMEHVGPSFLNIMNLSVDDNSCPIIEELDSEEEEFDSSRGTLLNEKMVFKINEPPPAFKKSLPPVPEFNILLLGETGAGKSTSINALANYLRYTTFEEATNNEFVQLIPSRFTLPHPQTGEPMDIVSGKDDNELSGDGNSSTQSPIGYTFRFGGGLIRLIDTPGMGDTSGVDVDNLNFDKILAYLNYHKNLHGICILMKSTETRKTAYFRYCINELLTHLHKSACRNIIFCFTFSRNSFYGPGEGFSTLRGFLMNELKDVQLPLKPSVNCFFIDNEAYRFLVAKKQGYPFKPKQEVSYKESWDTSVEQTELMMETIMGLEPHKLTETCSLNNARKLILELAEPMVKLQANINANIAHIKAEEIRIKNSNETKQDLARSLHIEVDDLESKELPYPATVCTSSKCTEVVKFDGQQKINYKTRCHPHCYLTGVTVNTIGDPILKGCAAMAGRPHCQGPTCGCPWDKHMHQCCEYIKVKRTIIDTNKQKEIKSAEDAIKQIDAAILKMRQVVSEYQDEFKVIHDVCSKFAYILISNSNTPYNRFIEPYLNLLIDEEQKKMSAIPGYSREAYDSLLKMRSTHQENVRILTEAIKNKSKENVFIQDITKFREELFQLKHSGPQFQQMLKVGAAAKKVQFEYTERPPVYFTKQSGIFASSYQYASKKTGKLVAAPKKKNLMITDSGNDNKEKKGKWQKWQVTKSTNKKKNKK